MNTEELQVASRFMYLGQPQRENLNLQSTGCFNVDQYPYRQAEDDEDYPHPVGYLLYLFLPRQLHIEMFRKP